MANQNPEFDFETIKEIIERSYQRARFVDLALAEVFDADSTLGIDALSPEQVKSLRAVQASGSLVIDLRNLSEYLLKVTSANVSVTGENVEAGSLPLPPAAQAVRATEAPKPQVAPPPRRQVPQRQTNTTDAAKINQEKLESLQRIAAEQAQAQAAAQQQAAEQRQQRLLQQEQEERARQEAIEAQRLIEEQQAQEQAAQAPAPAATPVPAPKPVQANAPRQVAGAARVLSAYERLMLPDNSPLTFMFAPSPWLPNGQGDFTIGSSEFGDWYKSKQIDVTNFEDTVRLPSGFYGESENGPMYAVIRLNTCIAVWNFGYGPNDLHIFHSIMNPKPEDLTFRPVHACASSALRRFLEELGKVYGVSRNALVVESK